MFAARLLPWAIGLAALFWPLRWAATGRMSLRTPADWPVLALAATLPVTLWTTVLPDKTLPQVWHLLAGLAAFYAIANWARSPKRLQWFMAAMTLAGTLFALSAFLTVIWSRSKLPFIPRELYSYFPLLTARPVNPNEMAGILMILLPYPLALLLFSWKSVSLPFRVLAIVASGVLGLVLLLTQSRGALSAALVALTAMAMLRWRKGWLLLPLYAGTLLIPIQRFGARNVANLALDGAELRLEIWSRALFMIEDFPYTGIGMGSFTEVADTMYPFLLYPPGRVQYAHNLFLQVAVDLGIPGLIAWLVVLMLVAQRAWQLHQHGLQTGRRWPTALGVGTLGSMIALTVHGLVDAIPWGRPAPAVWALWGLIFAAWHAQTSQKDFQGDMEPSRNQSVMR